MPSLQEYAQLSNRVYFRTDENRSPIPTGWIEDVRIKDQAASGFSAGVYRKGDDIVIAYTGTNERLIADFAFGNIPAYSGGDVSSLQVWEAMKLYLEVKRTSSATANITFTGHSLGGGLAAMMGIFFNREARVFDAAPFKQGALSTYALAAYKAKMVELGFTNTEFDTYRSAISSQYSAREGNVFGQYLQGEFVSYLRNTFTAIGLNLPIATGPTAAGALDLHSMTLLASMERSTAFADAVRNSPHLLAQIFDSSLYYYDPEVRFESNFIDRLYIAQVSNAATPLLDRFGTDAKQLTVAGGTTADAAMQKALNVAALDYYYYKTPASASGLFTTNSGAVNFNLSDVGVAVGSLKSPTRLADALATVADRDGNAVKSAAASITKWHVQSGTGAMTWAGSDDLADVAVGGTARDTLNGGGGNDLLVGLGGADSLTGAAGNDTLVGGVGNDTLDGGAEADLYVVSANAGTDTIISSEAADRLKLDGRQLNGDGTLISESANIKLWMGLTNLGSPVTYRYEVHTQKLTVASAGSLVVIDDFVDGDVGIFIPKKPKTKSDPTTNTNFRSALPPPVRRDPLAIDLNGNGIETVGIGVTPILFDHNADGIRTGTGWVKANDAWLVLDRNGNGLIDSGRELFGVDTLLSGTPGVDAVYASTGFAALAKLDSNNDRVFNASDAAFTQVQLWQDLNQDGISQSTELFTLAQKNIASISLTPTASTVNLGNGNTVTGQALVTRTNGSTTQIDSVAVGADTTAGNLNLANNPFYRQFTDSIPLTAEALTLPEMAGSGVVRDLREAMSLGNAAAAALVSAVQVFAQGTTRDAQLASLDALLRTWAATEAIADRFSIQPVGAETRRFAVTGSTDTALQAKLARIIPVLEVFNGVTVDESGWTSTISTENGVQIRTYTMAAQQAASMQASYDSLSTSVYLSLVAQTRLKPYLAGTELVVDASGARLDTSVLASLLDTRKVANEREAAIDLVEFLHYASPILQATGFDGLNRLRTWVDAMPVSSPVRADLLSLGVRWGNAAGTNGADILLGDGAGNSLVGNDGNDQIAGGAGNDWLQGGGGNDTLDGGVGSDTLYGAEGDNLLIGGEGADTLGSGVGNDTLDGGAGADDMRGGAGDDVYRWRAADGNDFIVEESGNDVIELQGLAPADVRITRTSSSDMLIQILSTGETLKVSIGFSEGNTDSRIESLRFADGTVWDDTAIRANTSMTGSAGAESIYGHATDNTLLGLGGDDSLYAGAGNDTLDGGTGADRLEGGTGDDTYRWGTGSANDTVSELGVATGGIDTLELQGLNPTDINVRRDGQSNIIVHNIATGEQLVVTRGFDESSPEAALEQVRFASGFLWDQAALRANAIRDGDVGVDFIYGHATDDLLRGQGGNDALFGGGGNDTLDGGTGNDSLFGDGGNNTYLFGRGDGQDTIDTRGSGAGLDTLLFKSGVSPSDVVLKRVPYFNGTSNQGDWALQVSIAGTSDRVSVNRFFFNDDPGNYLNPLREIRFADNTAWNVQAILDRTFAGTAADDTYLGTIGNDVLNGASGNDSLSGRVGNDTLKGGTGADTLRGEAGLDELTGGTGRDLLYGGDGDDTYLFNRGDAQDVIGESQGDDVIRFGPGIVESEVTLVRTSSTAVDFAGWFSSSYAADSLVISLAGSDEIWIPGFFTAAGSIEAIEFSNGTRWLAADMNARVVSAQGTVNSQTGTAGNDSFVVDHPLDSIGEAAGAGVDSVTSSVSYTLPVNVENLSLTGSINAAAIGNTQGNVINGNDGDNVLNGLQGKDTLSGGAGDDIYVVTSDQTTSLYDVGNLSVLADANATWGHSLPWDAVIERAGEGVDTLVTSQYRVQLPDEVENMIVASMAVRSLAYDYLRDTASNTLRPITFLAADRIYDGRDSDTRPWFVGNALANQIDVTNGRPGATFSGYDASLFNGVLIDGGEGADTMTGGAEDTYYRIDQVGDVVVETGSDSVSTRDTLISSTISLTLVDRVENIELLGSVALSATGDDRNNELRASKNTAINHLTGLGGDDVYFVDAGDVVIEAVGGGTDTVVIDSAAIGAPSGLSSGAVFRLDNYANVENIFANGKFDWKYPYSVYGVEGVRLVGNAGANRVVGSFWNDVLEGGGGNDVIEDQQVALYPRGADFMFDSDTLTGGEGDDRLISWYGGDLLDGGNGNDVLIAKGAGYILQGGDGADTLFGGSGGILRGGAGDDALSGGSYGVDTFDGGTGNDTINDLGGGDVVYFGRGDGQDVIKTFFYGTPTSRATIEFKMGILAADVVARRVADGQFSGLAGLELSIVGTDDKIVATGYFDTGAGNYSAVQQVRFADGTLWDAARIQQEITASPVQRLVGTMTADTLAGGDSADALYGLSGSDMLSGNAGNDTLDGGAGADTMVGGIGDDLYRVDDAADVLVENVDAGWDMVESSVTWALADQFDVLRLQGSNDINATGNASNNILYGNAGANRLDGGGGWDSLIGGSGNDTYVVDNLSDSTTEFSGGGLDAVESSITWTLSSHVENLTLTGTAALNGTGNFLDNVLRGNTGANVLNGAAGNDTLIGGAGNDVYVVDVATDVVTEATNEGTDTVESESNWTLDANFENLTLTGSAAISGTGNAVDNVLTGNTANNTLTGGAGNDTLSGGAGADTMVGGAGNDLYVVDATTDVLTEAANEGYDSVQSTATHTLTNNIEALTLTGTAAINGNGNALDNTLTGNSANNTLNGGVGNDTLTGGAGNDTLIGGAGDDLFVVDVTTDVVTEAANEGTDTVQSTVTWTLSANVENLTLTSAAAINGTGNTLNNVITGNSGANTLSGGAGSDTLAGGAGNDIYVIDVTTDVITEAANEGTDTVQSAVTWTLGAHLENLTLTGTTAINGTGNALNNVLTGNSGANTLSGDAGNDTLVGGAGNDIYVVDVATDVVTEAANEGTDTILSAVTWTLGANLENLTLTGTAAINGTGNTLNNVLTGNAVANTLSGGAGNDTLVGGAGDDVYVVDVTTDIVTEAANEGNDTVQSVVTWTLGANIENLTLTGTAAINGTGNTLNNVVTGNSGANTLSGGAGNDTLIGGASNDIYVVDVTTDVVTEATNEGTDTVQSVVTWTLGANLENLTLTGTAVINGTGNTLDNALTGNIANNTLTGGAGNDTLNGGAGTDSLVGGVGNDLYVVDVASDVVTEAVNEGTDTVQSSVTWTLGADLENLTLTGTSAINGAGNALNNVITGNTGTNTLTGGAGNDTLVGGAGNDTYVVDVATDVVTEAANEGTDTVQAAVTWTLGANVENLTLTGTAVINGTGNTLDNVLTGNSANNTLTGGAGNDTLNGGTGTDTLVGGAGNDTYVVDVATDLVTEAANEGTDLVQSTVTLTLGLNLENLTLTGTSAINGAGNTLDNSLTGNSGANVLTGGEGNDSYTGGLGSDTLSDTSTTSNDVYVWGRGQGADILTDAGGTDRLNLLAGVTEDQVWLRRLGNNLELSVIGTTDSLTINGWYTSPVNQIERFQLSDGQALLSTQVQQLVDAMAAFAPPAAGQTTLPANYATALNPVIAPSWA